MTQSAKLINAIRRSGARGMTYMDLESLRVSTCPWRRLSPGEKPERHLGQHERLMRFTGKDGLVRFRIVKAGKPLVSQENMPQN